MKRRDIVVGLTAGAAALVLVSRCSSTNALRYKMVVEVQTPVGVRTGFAVREMTLDTDNIMAHNVGGVRGQAVMVDLPSGQVLFALLTGGDGDADYAMQIGGRVGVWGESPSEPRTTPVQLFPSAPVTLGVARTDPLPMLVRFRNILDPQSVEQIDPTDLARVFGSGYSLRRITIAATDEPVNTGIEKYLIWLGKYPEISLKSPHAANDKSLAASLKTGDFLKGNSK